MSEETRFDTWYFTFGMAHPLKKHVQPIFAPSCKAARLKMVDMYGWHWSDVYSEPDFDRLDEECGPYTKLPRVTVFQGEADAIACRMEEGWRWLETEKEDEEEEQTP